MKEIVFNEKAADFFNSENEKTLDNVAVTIVPKNILKEKDKEIERLNGENEQLNSSINGCQEEIKKLRNRINNTVEYINNPSYFDGGYMTKHDLLMLLSGTIVKGHSIRDINKIKKQLQELKGDSNE